MRNNILRISEQHNAAALLRGLATHTPAEAEIEPRDLLVVGELEGDAAFAFVVIVYAHRTTGRLFTKPEVIAKSVLAQLEADGS